jgi:hypothetical protein
MTVQVIWADLAPICMSEIRDYLHLPHMRRDESLKNGARTFQATYGGKLM